jgi:hypothetical protein
MKYRGIRTASAVSAAPLGAAISMITIWRFLMKKSLLALLLVVSMLLSVCLLASCGDDGIIVDEGMPEENPIPNITVVDDPTDPNASGNEEDYTAH